MTFDSEQRAEGYVDEQDVLALLRGPVELSIDGVRNKLYGAIRVEQDDAEAAAAAAEEPLPDPVCAFVCLTVRCSH